MSKQSIWNFLKHKGFSDIAAAALMGNMEAESNCVSNRLQGDFTNGFKRSIEYTAQVDAGNISRHEFIYDGPGGGGYGLCQWTYHPRKAGLYDLAQEQNVSIGDEFIQVEWLTRELWQDEYKAVREILEKSPSIRECSDVIVKQFLRPADQSEAVCKYRADLGRAFYQQFSEAEAEDPDGIPEEGKVTITGEEFRIYSRAVLVVMTLRDLLKAMEEFK
ncbi:MAG: hypothetical protein IJG40_04035 [Oscillospiraceae bacterium]|nr:hypothetical protein [Oscillospiraceae bacterium]